MYSTSHGIYTIVEGDCQSVDYRINGYYTEDQHEQIEENKEYDIRYC